MAEQQKEAQELPTAVSYCQVTSEEGFSCAEFFKHSASLHSLQV